MLLLLSLLVSISVSLAQDEIRSVIDHLVDESHSIQIGKANGLLPRGTLLLIASSEIDNWFNLNGAGIGEYKGWYICDGRNGTPDLRGRVPVGRDVMNMNTDFGKMGNTGGANHVTLGVDQMPAHTHNVRLNTNTAGSHYHLFEDIMFPANSHSTNPRPDIPNHKVAVNSQSQHPQWYHWMHYTHNAGDHSHSINGATETAGSSRAFDNRQPYFVIAYIIYIGK